MNALQLVKLEKLMERTSGRPEVKVGLIDGPVVTQHPDLAGQRLLSASENNDGAMCAQANSTACVHGTFVAGVLAAKRSSSAPAICPGCTLVIRPVFAEQPTTADGMPCTTSQELAMALAECIDAGASVINLSLSLAEPSTKGEQTLDEAFNEAARWGVVVVAAAGNQGSVGSTAITRHPWVIPVAACDLRGQPLQHSNVARSIGVRGLSAPGDSIRSSSSNGQSLTLSGTSVAAPFVTGTVALLRSEFPAASASQIKLALLQGAAPRRRSVVPPLLDATAACQFLQMMR